MPSPSSSSTATTLTSSRDGGLGPLRRSPSRPRSCTKGHDFNWIYCKTPLIPSQTHARHCAGCGRWRLFSELVPLRLSRRMLRSLPRVSSVPSVIQTFRRGGSRAGRHNTSDWLAFPSGWLPQIVTCACESDSEGGENDDLYLFAVRGFLSRTPPPAQANEPLCAPLMVRTKDDGENLFCLSGSAAEFRDMQPRPRFVREEDPSPPKPKRGVGWTSVLFTDAVSGLPVAFCPDLQVVSEKYPRRTLHAV